MNGKPSVDSQEGQSCSPTDIREFITTQQNLIQELREEATEAKRCFTDFSFKTITFVTAALGFILGTIQSNIFAALACIPAIIILQVICRIGIYKYKCANRAYGFQGYVEGIFNSLFDEVGIPNNTTNNKNSACDTEEYKALLMIIEHRNWEQLFSAWRIIASALERSIYIFPSDSFNISNIKNKIFIYSLKREIKLEAKKYSREMKRIRKENSGKSHIKIDAKLKEQKIHYPWFLLREITNGEFQPGNYLNQMLSILHLLQVIFIVLFGYAVLHFKAVEAALVLDIGFGSYKLDGFILSSIVFAYILLYSLYSYRIINRRKEINERELYSIHGCSLVWHIVALAHYKAIQHAYVQSESMDSLFEYDRAYLAKLTELATGFNDFNNIFKIRSYLDSHTKNSKGKTENIVPTA